MSSEKPILAYADSSTGWFQCSETLIIVKGRKSVSDYIALAFGLCVTVVAEIMLFASLQSLTYAPVLERIIVWIGTITFALLFLRMMLAIFSYTTIQIDITARTVTTQVSRPFFSSTQTSPLDDFNRVAIYKNCCHLVGKEMKELFDSRSKEMTLYAAKRIAQQLKLPLDDW